MSDGVGFPDPRLGQLPIIWVALMLGVASYAVTAVVIVFVVGLELLDGSIVNLVAVASIGLMVLGMKLRRSQVAKIPSDIDPADRLQRYSAACVVGLALAESGGFALITLGMISSSLPWIAAGAGATVGAMFLQRPSAEEAGLAGDG